MPPPDLVLRLRLTLAVALERNAARREGGGPEPEKYVVERFAQVDELRFPSSRTIEVDASGSREETLRGAKRAIWSALSARRPADDHRQSMRGAVQA